MKKKVIGIVPKGILFDMEMAVSNRSNTIYRLINQTLVYRFIGFGNKGAESNINGHALYEVCENLKEDM